MYKPHIIRAWQWTVDAIVRNEQSDLGDFFLNAYCLLNGMDREKGVGMMSSAGVCSVYYIGITVGIPRRRDREQGLRQLVDYMLRNNPKYIVLNKQDSRSVMDQLKDYRVDYVLR